jgi:hypothetical protein
MVDKKTKAIFSEIMREIGRKGGKIGGKRRLETLTPDERSARAATGPQNMTGGGAKQCRIPATQTWGVAEGVGKK